MKLILLGLVMIALAGCAGLGQVTTTVTLPNGEIFTVISKSDALVEFQQGDTKGKVDNRGKPGMIEQAIALLLMNMPDVVIGTK